MGSRPNYWLARSEYLFCSIAFVVSMVGEVTASAGDEQPLMGGEGNEEKAAAQGCLLAIY